MPLKAVLESLDGLDDAQKGLYRQDGEAFVLDVDGDSVRAHPEVKGLAAKRDELLKLQRELKDELAKFKDVDPVKYRELLDAARQEEEGKLASKGEWETLRDNLVAEHKREVEKLTRKHTEELDAQVQAVAKRDRFIERATIDRELREALDKVGIVPHYRTAVMAMMREKKPLVVSEEEDYRGIFKTETGDVTIADFVSKWASTEDAEAYLPPSGKRGSGATQSAGNGTGATIVRRDASGVIRASPEKILSGEQRVGQPLR